MKRAILPLALVTLGVVLLGWLMWTAFGGQRADVAVARSFLSHVAASEFDAADALMTPALQARLGAGGLQRAFGQIEPWERSRFRSRTSNGFGDTRTTRLLGFGTTPSGCTSDLATSPVNGAIDAFSVNPLCPATDLDV